MHILIILCTKISQDQTRIGKSFQTQDKAASWNHQFGGYWSYLCTTISSSSSLASSTPATSANMTGPPPSRSFPPPESSPFRPLIRPVDRCHMHRANELSEMIMSSSEKAWKIVKASHTHMCPCTNVPQHGSMDEQQRGWPNTHHCKFEEVRDKTL